MKRIIFLIVLLLFFSIMPQSRGDEQEEGFRSWFTGWNFSGSNFFQYQYNDHLDDEVTKNRFRNVIDATFSKNEQNLIFGVTFEVGNFFPKDPDVREDIFKRLDKIYVQWSPRELDFTLGDFYAVFGRGLALNVTRNDVILETTSIRGGKGIWEHSGWSLQALGGIMTTPSTGELDKIGGVELAKSFLDRRVKIFGHYVGFDDYNDVSIDPLVNLGGGGIEISSIFNFVDVYAEYNASQSDYGYIKQDGHGAYVSADFYFSNISVLAEYHDYKNFNFKFNVPPTGDHETEYFPKLDNHGFRIEPQYYIQKTNTSVFFNVGRYESPSYDHTLYHVYGGVEQWDLFDRMYLYTYLSYRRIPDKTTKLFVDTSTGVTDFDSILFTFVHRNIEDIYDEYTEDEVTIGYARAPWLAVSFLWQYTERLVIDKNHFLGCEFQGNVLENLTLKLFAGSLKGGVICSGGSCYFEKPFKGVRLSALYRF